MGPRRPQPWWREPPPLPLPAPSGAAGIRDGSGSAPSSAPAPRERRTGRSPHRPVPFPQPGSRSRPGAPRVRGSRGEPAPQGREGLSRSSGGAALSRAAPPPAHKQAAVPPLARRPRHQKPAPSRLVRFAGTRAKGARGCQPVLPTERLPSPPSAARAAAALPPPGPPGLRGPRTARSGGGRCGGAVAVALALPGRQAAALGAALAPAEYGWTEVPALGRGPAGEKPRGTVLPKVEMLPCLRAAATGRRRRQETGGSWPQRAAPLCNFRAGPATTVSCPAQGDMAALETMDPAVRNALNWGHLVY